MMADRYRGAIYTGVTSDLPRRMVEHRSGKGSEFVKNYGLRRLVHAEPFERIEEAIAREKALKKWRRTWKIELIESANPDWRDLFDHLIGA
jgi:putative endonuclease